MARFTGEDGFTLTELLIVIVILGMMMAGIYGVYVVSQQIYTRSSSLEAAQLGVRAGLDRMATELRLIGYYWTGATGAGDAVTAATSTSITFLGDVDGDTVSNNAETTVAAGITASGTTVQISGTATQAANAFNVYSNAAQNDYVYIANGKTREVKQTAGVAGTTITLATALTTSYTAGSIVRSVETVTCALNGSNLTRSVGGGAADTIVDNVTGLALTYFDTNGNNLGPTPNTTLIREIRISLTTQGSDGSHRTMTSRVRLRN